MIVYVLKAVYGGYFNDYTTGYKLTYIKEREKTVLLYYDENIDNFLDFVYAYKSKNGSTVEINRNGYYCDLIIDVTNDRKNVLKTLSTTKLDMIELKCNNKKQFYNKVKKLFEVGETK